MKKIVAVILIALIFTLQLVSCDNGNKNIEDFTENTEVQDTAKESEKTDETDSPETEDTTADFAILSSLVTNAEEVKREKHNDDEWNAFCKALEVAKSVDENADKEKITATSRRLSLAIEAMKDRSVPNHIDNMYLIPYNNPDLHVPIQVGLHAYPAFYDMDGDGKMDFLMLGKSRSYGGEGGGLFLFRNYSDALGNTDFGRSELLMLKSRLLFSYKQDKSPFFVGEDGTFYTEMSFKGPTNPKRTSNIKRSFKLCDMDGDGVSDAVYQVLSSSGTNAYDKDGNSLIKRMSTLKWIKNTGTEDNPNFGSFERSITNAQGGEFSVYDYGQYTYFRSFGLFDADGDGDNDLIAGGWMNEFYYYENVGNEKTPKFNNTGVKIETQSGPLELDCCRYNMINYDWDGDSKDDLVIGAESGTALFLRFTGKFNPETHAPIFEDGKYFTQKAEYLAVNALSRPTACDFDGDGDTDFIVGDNGGYLWFLENLTGGTNPSWAAPVKLKDSTGKIIVVKAGPSGSVKGIQEAEWGYTIPCACDFDGDGDIDVVVNSVTGRVIWFENIGTKTSPQLTQSKAVEVEWVGENKHPNEMWWTPVGNELVTQHRTTPYCIDLNKDGLIDLVMLDYDGYLSFYERYKDGETLKFKEGKRVFLNERGEVLRLNSNEGGEFGRVKIALTDYDNDGDIDVLVTEYKCYSIIYYENVKESNGNYYLKRVGELSRGRISGHHPGFTVLDFNGDGKTDIITGTEAGYFYYIENKIA